MIIEDPAKLGALRAEKDKSIEKKGTPGVPFVFWDGYGLDQSASGVFVHAKSMVRELVELGVSPILLGNRKSAGLFEELANLVVPEASIYGRKLADSKLVWPERVARYLDKVVNLANISEPVILHGLSNLNLPALGVDRTRFKAVVTVHDLIPLQCPEGVSRSYYWQFKTVMPRILKVAQKIVCVSDWTCKTVVDAFPAEAHKTVVIKNGLRNDWRQRLSPKDQGGRQPQKGEPVHMICNTRYESYKDIGTLFDVIRKGAGRYKLTLVTNSRGLEYAGNRALDLLKSRELTLLTNLSLSDLDKVYGAGHVYVHPSRYEGYCLPAAEALMAGLPVVYLAGSGIDEVVGQDVGIALARGATARDWEIAIDAALETSASPRFRDRLEAHLATLPTWKDSALGLKSLYNDLLNA